MKNMILTTFMVSIFIINSYGQNIKEIEIKPIQTNVFNICPSNCEDCGMVIFTTHIPGLLFESNMDYIKDVKVDNEGIKYIYSVVAEARSTQDFIIKGPEIVDYKLTIHDLEPARCQDYIITIIEELPEIVAEEKAKKIAEEMAIKMAEEMAKKMAEEMAVKMAEEIAKKKAEEMAIKIAEEKVRKETINNDLVIKKHGKKQRFWLSSAIISAGIGGYLKYTADQKYDEYLVSTDPNEIQDLKETVQLYDKLTPAFFGIAGLCSVNFIVQTTKKSKRKNKLQVELNGRSARLTYKF